MPSPLEILVPASADNKRLDLFLATAPELSLSRSQIQKLVESGAVLLDGVRVKSKHPLETGQRIQIDLPVDRPSLLRSQKIPFGILYEDKDLIVVNKPAGLVVHPGAGNPDGTLVNALIEHLGPGLQTIFGSQRPGLVHRLDKDTSGCMVVAKTQDAFKSLTKQIGDHSAGRTYLALVWGRFDEDEGSIDAPLGRSGADRRKFAVRMERGKRAVTHFKVRERFTHAVLLELRLETGRTHQIRAHLSSIGRPIVGDPDYGHAPASLPPALAAAIRKAIPRQALHAWKLELEHPSTGKRMVSEAPIPEDFLLAQHLLTHPPLL
ncbi:MAG: RluA family pseudouridine synthase [candidate division FCPU426 bacterium]